MILARPVVPFHSHQRQRASRAACPQLLPVTTAMQRVAPPLAATHRPSVEFTAAAAAAPADGAVRAALRRQRLLPARPRPGAAAASAHPGGTGCPGPRHAGQPCQPAARARRGESCRAVVDTCQFTPQRLLQRDICTSCRCRPAARSSPPPLKQPSDLCRGPGHAWSWRSLRRMPRCSGRPH